MLVFMFVLFAPAPASVMLVFMLMLFASASVMIVFMLILFAPALVADNQIDSFRPHIHSIHDLSTAFFHGDMLEEFSYTVKQHNSGTLSEITYAESCNSCDGHEEVLIKNLSADNISQCCQQHAPSQDEICRTAYYKCRIEW